MKPFRRIALCIVLALAALPFASAQEDTLRLGFSVRGKVVDATSGRAVEAAYVSVNGRNHATVTNADGVFVLRSDREIGSITVSCLGYKTAVLDASGDDLSKIRLQRSEFTLDAAVVSAGSARALVMEALDRLWDTYCTQPELLECFYRETVQKKGRFTYVAEAVARIYKEQYRYGGVHRDNAALEKSRVLVSQRRSDTLSVKFQGGPTQATAMDVLKNKDILFNRQDMDLYSFELDRPAFIDGRSQLVVKVKPFSYAPYALYYGTLYIDQELLTFTRIELSLDMSDIGKARDMLLVKKPTGLRFTPQEATMVINYRLTDGKTRLEYMRTTIRFTCDWRRRLIKTNYTCVNELVVTDVRPEAVPIPRNERFNTRDILNDKASEFLDPDFWEGYNIIEPSESLEHAISRLRRR